MGRPLVSVVMATYQRKHLLWRSLLAYRDQEFDNKELELVVVDDFSTDGTAEYLKDWTREIGVRTTILTTGPKDTLWRDCGAVINAGIRASSGKHVLLTHPEVIPGKKSVAACVEQLEKGTKCYACCRVYYLSPRDQERLDTVRWLEDGNLAVRQIPGFYADDVNGHPDYCHVSTDNVGKPGFRIPKWESWVFGGCSRRTWKFLGGMLETREWGAVDIAFMARRRTLGIHNHTCPDDDTIVVHQNHDGPGNVPTPRDMDKWMAELRDTNLTDPEAMRYPAVDNLGWD